MITSLSNELLSKMAFYLIEPSMDILSIGWKDNKYTIALCKNSYNNKLIIYHDIINYYIFKNEYNNLFSLYNTIYNLNNSLRQYTPTYIFKERIFKIYKYISYPLLIGLEYDKEVNITKKIKEIENCHLIAISNLKKYILKELKYFIYYYNNIYSEISFNSYYFHSYYFNNYYIL